MDDPWVIGTVLTLGFVVFFAGLWFLITKLLLHLAGWPKLEQHFPDQPHDQAVEKWSFATAAMGRSAVAGVSFRNSLTIEACQTGLRIKIMRLLAPFSKAIFVPWSQITTESGIFGTMLVMMGEPEKGCLRIRSKFGRKIEAAARGQFTMPSE